MKQHLLVDFQNFIQATRDSGYKNTAAAIAELVDNAIEAHATLIDIKIEKQEEDFGACYELSIYDNGKGMTEKELSLALQFGGSTRFNSRRYLGRYGMGLPNSSLSQCRRVEVQTWVNRNFFIYTHLDIDEVLEQNLTHLPKPRKSRRFKELPQNLSGTIVRWKKCDRLSFKYKRSLIKHISFELGRIFRYAIWRGVQIRVCDHLISAFDPLFIGEGENLRGGIPYGNEMTYKIRIPDTIELYSTVKVRFIELPLEEWSLFTNEEKRKFKISKYAGVAVVRSEREIDYGWFYMGDKRKENYDDWWRCEISFNPELDEVFGVTHTKQEIKETEYLREILTTDMAQISRALNSRVRMKFMKMKDKLPKLFSKKLLERNDRYMPSIKPQGIQLLSVDNSHCTQAMQYQIVSKELKEDVFFEVEENENCIKLTINTGHMFYHKVFKALHEKKINNSSGYIKILEVLLFSVARSEFSFTSSSESKIIQQFKKEWSMQLKTMIS